MIHCFKFSLGILLTSLLLRPLGVALSSSSIWDKFLCLIFFSFLCLFLCVKKVGNVLCF